MNEFYEILRDIRLETGLTQKEFAKQIGMKPAAYNMIESGKNQPSYLLLTSLVSVFSIDANRFFLNRDASEYGKAFGVTIKELNETDFLNLVHDQIGKIKFLYNRLVDVRILLFQELKLKGDFSSETEADLLTKLTFPFVKEVNEEASLQYPYDNLDKKGKEEYLQKLEACKNLFTNTFFECFGQLYKGIRIPLDKEFAKALLENRAELTSHWTYSHVLK